MARCELAVHSTKLPNPSAMAQSTASIGTVSKTARKAGMVQRLLANRRFAREFGSALRGAAGPVYEP